MGGRWSDGFLAIVGGVLLALMIDYNSLLAQHTTPTFASWVAHGIGAGTALLLLGLHRQRSRAAVSGGPAGATGSVPATPRWLYLGGIPGALTVILAAIAVNGGLALSGTIAFMLTGQVTFGILSDRWGLLGIPRRRIRSTDVLAAALVLAGSALILFGGN